MATPMPDISRRNPQDDFELIQRVGSGTYGDVYKARHIQTSEMAAIKIIKLEPGDDFAIIQQEILMMRDCRQENIVAYYGTYLRRDKLWICMEYCGGGSMQDIYHITGPLMETEIAYVCRETLKGLHYLHNKGKIHRDIKGANILLTETGDVKLADFGVSAQITQTMCKRKSFIGTPYWMAPEVAAVERKGGYNHLCDIWAVGITAIELAELQPPMFDLHPMRALFLMSKSGFKPPTLKDKTRWTVCFQNFIKSALTKNPKRRPPAEKLLENPFLQASLDRSVGRNVLEKAQNPTQHHPFLFQEDPEDEPPENVPRRISSRTQHPKQRTHSEIEMEGVNFEATPIVREPHDETKEAQKGEDWKEAYGLEDDGWLSTQAGARDAADNRKGHQGISEFADEDPKYSRQETLPISEPPPLPPKRPEDGSFELIPERVVAPSRSRGGSRHEAHVQSSFPPTEPTPSLAHSPSTPANFAPAAAHSPVTNGSILDELHRDSSTRPSVDAALPNGEHPPPSVDAVVEQLDDLVVAEESPRADETTTTTTTSLPASPRAKRGEGEEDEEDAEQEPPPPELPPKRRHSSSEGHHHHHNHNGHGTSTNNNNSPGAKLDDDSGGGETHPVPPRRERRTERGKQSSPSGRKETLANGLPPTPAVRMGACFQKIFNGCPLKINCTASWVHPDTNDQLILIGAEEGIYTLNLNYIHESTMDLLYARRCSWLHVMKDVLMSLCGRTPQLYRHDLLTLHSKQTARFSLPMNKIPGRFEKLVPKRYAPTAKVPNTRGCYKCCFGRNAYNGFKYLCGALPNSIILMQWYEPLNKYMLLKHFESRLPSPVPVFEMFITPEVEYPKVCVGVCKGTEKSWLAFDIVDLNSNQRWYSEPPPDRQLNVVNVSQWEKDTILVCYDYKTCDAVVRSDAPRNMAPPRGHVVQLVNMNGKPKSKSVKGGNQTASEIHFEFPVESIVALRDGQLLAFHKHGLQGRSFKTNEVTQETSDESKEYRLLGSDALCILESKPVNEPEALSNLYLLRGHEDLS